MDLYCGSLISQNFTSKYINAVLIELATRAI